MESGKSSIRDVLLMALAALSEYLAVTREVGWIAWFAALLFFIALYDYTVGKWLQVTRAIVRVLGSVVIIGATFGLISWTESRRDSPTKTALALSQSPSPRSQPVLVSTLAAATKTPTARPQPMPRPIVTPAGVLLDFRAGQNTHEDPFPFTVEVRNQGGVDTY